MLYALRRRALALQSVSRGAGATVRLCQSRPFASFQHPGRRVAELVGASRLVTLAETGHLPMDERPEELAALLLEWVLGSEQPPPPSTVSK